MDAVLKPILLLADSQLLFSKGPEAPLKALYGGHLAKTRPKAAYIGASNGDDPAFYEIFAAAMEHVPVHATRMVCASFGRKDRDFLEQAGLILLAGGDVALGWEVMATTGMAEVIQQRYLSGCVLVGVSAGSVQLGLRGRKTEAGKTVYFETLGLAPLLVDCHDEARDWGELQTMVGGLKLPAAGVGIPFGGGLLYHPDHTLQPIAKPIVEFSMMGPDHGITRSLLYPGAIQKAPPEPPSHSN